MTKGDAMAPTETSPRTAARVAGLSYALIFGLAIYANFAVRMRLIVPDDATSTSENLARSETAVRFAVAAFIVVFLLDVIIAWALYVLFRPFGARAALHASWFRLVYTIFLGVASVFLFLALRLATSTYGDGVQVDQAVMLALDAFEYAWLIGLAAFGLHLMLVGHIMIKSRAAPALLGWILAVAGTAYLADTFAHVLLAGYQSVAGLFLILVAVPSVVGELAFTLWLLTRAPNAVSARLADAVGGEPLPKSGASATEAESDTYAITSPDGR